MFRTWKNFFAKKPRPSPAPRRSTRPRLEALEDRVVPAFMLRLEQAGFTPLTITDNDANDQSSTVGRIQYIGSYGTFDFNATAARTKPLTDSTLRMSSLNMSSTVGGTLIITAADTDYTVPSASVGLLTMETEVGGVTEGATSVTVQGWANADNLSPLTGPTTVIPAGSTTAGPIGPLTGSLVVGEKITNFVRNSTPYSQFLQTTITINGAGEASLDSLTKVYGPDLLPSSICGYVYHDADNDGAFDAGESPIPGTSVTLTGTNDLGAITPVTVQTDANGLYCFLNLRPGTYTVTETQPSGYLDGKDTQGTPGTGTTNNDQFANIVLAAGVNGVNNNFGELLPAKLGDFVWEDKNANGIQDAGEPGIVDVTVKLLDTSGNVLKTTTTDSNGLYLFDNLIPGTYCVMFVAPPGYVASPKDQGGDDAVDSDADTTTGKTGTYTLVSGETNLTVDAGFYRLAKLGDFVWNDANANGIQDAGEPGIVDVTVKLLDTSGNVLKTTTTDSNGLYLFDNLVPGTYCVMFVAPSGYSFSPKDQGADDAKDSDADTTTGKTGTYTLVSGDDNRTVDAGLFRVAIDIEKFVKEVAPTGGAEGLTPGYWKQEHHFPTWVPTGYNPSDSFNTIFGVNDPDNPTLLQALQTGGGGFDALGRHAVAGLLNASHPTIEYAFSAAQVIAKVQSAYANPSSVESIKDQLANENERGADLGTSDGSGVGGSGPGVDADTAPGLIVQTGSQVTFTYYVTNPGQVALKNVVVKDDNETPGNTADDFNPAPVLSGGFNVGDLDKDNQLDVGERWEYTHGPITVTDGQHTNIGCATGESVVGNSSVLDQDAANWFGLSDIDNAGSLSGYVYHDNDDDGLIDFGEAGISGVTVKLSGTDSNGNAVNQTAVTNASGYYEFINLKAGTYALCETQPLGWVDGKDTVGSLGGAVSNDKFSTINLGANQDGINYNFGERLPSGNAVGTGRTATIGFWQNKNGQALIKSLNGGESATALANWLAATFPNLYGVNAGTRNLTGKTNAQVAAFFVTLFKVKGQKLDAQVLAVALAAYVTDSAKAGTVAEAYGFKVTNPGVGADTFNVGANGAAFGVANNTTMTVLDLLKAADAQAVAGVLYNNDKAKRDMANLVFTAINEAGDIL